MEFQLQQSIEILERTAKTLRSLQVTLRQLLATWATHDLGHLGQIVRVMAKQYGSEVGPWKEFISILKC